ncbi:MAG: ABC transporter permease [Ruminococcus sp.]|nr:ABC transporter permease [Ruminococcus sp.]
MKFFNLLKKELKEMLGLQTIMIMVVSVVALVFAGQAMSDAIDESSESQMDITICDLDKTEFTDAVVTALKAQLNESGGELKEVELESDDYPKELDRLDISSVVIIPEGFTDQVEKSESADVSFVQKMTSLATMSNLNTGSQTALGFISAAVKSTIYAQKVLDGTMTEPEIVLLENPVTLNETTVVADKSESISSSAVLSMCSMQNMVVPIIMFVLIMFSSQMILNTIATEKVDKTLETLLSAPISRLSVISAKMLSAGTVAALQAIVYMIGMNRMMSGFTDNLSAEGNYDKALEALGLTMGFKQYLLVGLQMFLSILIALSVSLILGALAKDAKSAQTLILPITLSTMIPYMLSMFLDLQTVSPALRYVVYAIPFTHTFMASQNAMFGNSGIYIGGIIYQLVFLIVCMTVALRIFMSDRIFTMTIGGKKKKNKHEAE